MFPYPSDPGHAPPRQILWLPSFLGLSREPRRLNRQVRPVVDASYGNETTCGTLGAASQATPQGTNPWGTSAVVTPPAKVVDLRPVGGLRVSPTPKTDPRQVGAAFPYTTDVHDTLVGPAAGRDIPARDTQGAPLGREVAVVPDAIVAETDRATTDRLTSLFPPALVAGLLVDALRAPVDLRLPALPRDIDKARPAARLGDVGPLPNVGTPRRRALPHREAAVDPDGPVPDKTGVVGDAVGVPEVPETPVLRTPAVATVVPDPRAGEGLPTEAGHVETASPDDAPGVGVRAARISYPVVPQAEAGVAPRLEGLEVAGHDQPRHGVATRRAPTAPEVRHRPNVGVRPAYPRVILTAVPLGPSSPKGRVRLAMPRPGGGGVHVLAPPQVAYRVPVVWPVAAAGPEVEVHLVPDLLAVRVDVLLAGREGAPVGVVPVEVEEDTEVAFETRRVVGATSSRAVPVGLVVLRPAHATVQTVGRVEEADVLPGGAVLRRQVPGPQTGQVPHLAPFRRPNLRRPDAIRVARRLDAVLGLAEDISCGAEDRLANVDPPEGHLARATEVRLAPAEGRVPAFAVRLGPPDVEVGAGRAPDTGPAWTPSMYVPSRLVATAPEAAKAAPGIVQARVGVLRGRTETRLVMVVGRRVLVGHKTPRVVRVGVPSSRPVLPGLALFLATVFLSAVLVLLAVPTRTALPPFRVFLEVGVPFPSSPWTWPFLGPVRAGLRVPSSATAWASSWAVRPGVWVSARATSTGAPSAFRTGVRGAVFPAVLAPHWPRVGVLCQFGKGLGYLGLYTFSPLISIPFSLTPLLGTAACTEREHARLCLLPFWTSPQAAVYGVAPEGRQVDAVEVVTMTPVALGHSRGLRLAHVAVAGRNPRPGGHAAARVGRGDARPFPVADHVPVTFAVDGLVVEVAVDTRTHAVVGQATGLDVRPDAAEGREGVPFPAPQEAPTVPPANLPSKGETGLPPSALAILVAQGPLRGPRVQVGPKVPVDVEVDPTRLLHGPSPAPTRVEVLAETVLVVGARRRPTGVLHTNGEVADDRTAPVVAVGHPSVVPSRPGALEAVTIEAVLHLLDVGVGARRAGLLAGGAAPRPKGVVAPDGLDTGAGRETGLASAMAPSPAMATPTTGLPTATPVPSTAPVRDVGPTLATPPTATVLAAAPGVTCTPMAGMATASAMAFSPTVS